MNIMINTMSIKRFLFAAAVAVLFWSPSSAQEKAVVYHDASAFPLYGKCVEATSARYERLPKEFEGVVRKSMWDLGRNSAGLYIRFRSNSTQIRARWRSLSPRQYMPHMADVGDSGLDLYILTEKDGWRFAGSGFEWGGRDKEVKNKTMVSNMEPSMREYMLYFSLYNGISSLEIGVDEGAVIEAPSIDSPRSDRPIVMYGTSILQGGCASRPGMAFTAILGRKLDREIINLGFSGNAWLDYEIAEYITRAQNPALIVLDYVPNSTAEMIDERGERFFRIVRQAFPDVPVIFVEDPTFPHTRFDRNMLEEVTSKNEAQKALYRRLKKAGEKKLYYVDTEGMIGDDGEATVDGIHLTDLGMMRYVDKLYPVMRKALR